MQGHVEEVEKAYKTLLLSEEQVSMKLKSLTEEIIPTTQKILSDYNGDTPKCLLKYLGPMTNPRRIIIAISGFLSEGADESHGWAQLIEHTNSKNIGTFNL